VTRFDKSESLRDRRRLERDDSEGTNLVGANLVGKQPQGSDSFAQAQEYEPGNDHVEGLTGNEGTEVGGDKARPIASTGHRCAPLGHLDGLR
jgi:hypothetical protein